MGNININDVIDVGEVKTLQEKWAKATNIAFVTVDVNGTPISEQSNFTPFCMKLREIPEFREKCYYCDACGGRKAKKIGKAYVYICHAGLVDFAIPIILKGQYLGAFLAGQIKGIGTDNLKCITNKLTDFSKSEYAAELEELYGQIQTMPVEKIEAVAQIICDSYNYSVEKEYSNKIDMELREKNLRLIKEEKLRIEMEKSLRDIELKALHYQINPHFMFNVLNTIGRLAFFENAKMTEDVVYAFSDMMRYILRKSSDPLSPLKDEITHVLNYLKIQKIRLGSRLQYSIDVKEEHYAVKLPFLAVVTVVENSIKHVIEKNANGGSVKIVAYQDGEDLLIEISDDGEGMSPVQINKILRGDAYKNQKENAVGLYNVNTRLMNYFGVDYALQIQSENKAPLGTKVIIRAPISYNR